MAAQNKVMELFSPGYNTPCKLPLGEVACGFPSPAEDYIENPLDLNEYLIKHPSATFFARAKGNSMIDAGIQDGDILIIDRAEKPANNKIVLAVVDGEFTVKNICVNDDKLYLMPKNPEHKPIEITDQMDFRIWGVVTYCIHKV